MMAICSHIFALKLGDFSQTSEIIGDASSQSHEVVGYSSAEYTFRPHKPQTSA